MTYAINTSLLTRQAESLTDYAAIHINLTLRLQFLCGCHVHHSEILVFSGPVQISEVPSVVLGHARQLHHPR